ncbi:MAG TPA: AI-2E family transporter [Chloroflexota bacterium]|nr:AI-2E family transporter [Chloroflexota bacterium]
MKHPNWTRILTILGVILATYALLYVTGTILSRFTQAILLFVLGAIAAYVLSPLVNALAAVVRVRGLAILLSYLLVAVLLFSIGILLFTPFVQQSQSLVDNLRNPSASTLKGIERVERDAAAAQAILATQQAEVTAALSLSSAQVSSARTSIRTLIHDTRGLSSGQVAAKVTGPRLGTRTSRSSATPPPQTHVPPSYVNAILAAALRLSADYASAVSVGNDPRLFKRAAGDAQATGSRARTIYSIMASTPILLIHVQDWVDSHGLKVDLHDKFGQAAAQLSNQGTYILNNAITILSETASLLLNLFLALIISVYFVSDGPRLIRNSINLLPRNFREQGWFFMESVDRVVGGYIRGQLFLSFLAGVLGGGGAAVLGVPYPLLIGLMTFVLESVPVVGPMLAVIPAVAISLFFNPPLVTLGLLVWFLVFQQIVTNVVGPRILGTAVGIHPLEALLAVLVGYPLGGLIGAFLAIPIMGIVHLLIREAYNYFVLGGSLPAAPLPAEDEPIPVEPAARL